jgi:hypothetical protein
MADGLKKKEFRHLFISDILPDFSSQPLRYQIIHDGHPNAMTHWYIAHYIIETLLGEKASQETKSVRPE